MIEQFSMWFFGPTIGIDAGKDMAVTVNVLCLFGGFVAMGALFVAAFRWAGKRGWL